MGTGGSIWEDRRLSSTCKNRNQNGKFCLVELRTYLDGAESTQGCSVFPRLTCQEAAGAAQLSCSAVWQAADCISAGDFLFLKVFPDICLPTHSAAPCTFALMYFTPEHFRRLVGLASASALAGLPLPAPKGLWGCWGWRGGMNHCLSTGMCSDKPNRVRRKAP